MEFQLLVLCYKNYVFFPDILLDPSTQACDEDVWREIDVFKSCLRRMAATASSSSGPDATSSSSSPLDINAKQRQKNAKKSRQSGGGVIFLETGGKPGASAARHTFIEAVPVHKNAFLDAPMYFKQVSPLLAAWRDRQTKETNHVKE